MTSCFVHCKVSWNVRKYIGKIQYFLPIGYLFVDDLCNKRNKCTFSPIFDINRILIKKNMDVLFNIYPNKQVEQISLIRAGELQTSASTLLPEGNINFWAHECIELTSYWCSNTKSIYYKTYAPHSLSLASLFEEKLTILLTFCRQNQILYDVFLTIYCLWPLRAASTSF